MVVFSNHLGGINITKRFFTALISKTVEDCYGVVGINAGNLKQTLPELFPFLRRFRSRDKGVSVKIEGGSLIIDLHISVLYGVNVSSVVKSIQHKVTYVIEEQTDMKVERVNVYVDTIKA